MDKTKQEVDENQSKHKLTPKLRFPEFREAGAWEEKKLGEVYERQSSNISANSLEGNTGEFKIYGAIGFLKDISFYTQEEKYIAIVKDGAGVGRTFLCEPKSSVLGTLDILTSKEKHGLYFLFLLINKVNFKKYIIGSTIPHIYFRDYSKEKINLPSLPEQQKIAACLSSLDELIEMQEQKLKTLKKHKKGLMQQLFPNHNEINK